MPRKTETHRSSYLRLPRASAVLLASLTFVLLLPLSGSALPESAPTSTSPPTISGTPTKGQTLLGSSGSWSGTTPIDFAFQWRRCDSEGANCSSISGATGTSYVLQSADVGKRLRLLVTASNTDGTASAVSDATGLVIAGAAPKNSAEPRISGTPMVGQRLSTTNGTWSGDQPMTFSYQWLRCPADGGKSDGSNCASISGATGTSYVLSGAEAGARIRVRVTATNSSGSQPAASNPTAIVKGSPPTNTKAPAITGTMVEGQTVTVSVGAWSGAAPITYSYQWLRCSSSGGNCVAIAGATSTQYKLTTSDVGHKIRVNVTARNSGGSKTVLSGESAVVQPSGPAGVVTLPSGEKSIPVTSVPTDQRLVVDRIAFTPGVVTSRRAVIGIRVRVKDTRGYVVRDALVFVRSTPLVTRAGQPRRTTSMDGYVTFQMSPKSTFPTARRTAVQFFVKAYRQGDNPLAGVAGYRLVQVRVAR